ncbi:hypothetical protein [Methylobacterium gregans]|uniref:hypothetical protein n=1 Tax=Methylobacterium gregans TaxID=374424 RepID=UPI00361EEBA8
MSSTSASGVRPAASNSASVSGAKTVSSTAWLRAQRWPTSPFQYAAWLMPSAIALPSDLGQAILGPIAPGRKAGARSAEVDAGSAQESASKQGL